MQFLKNSFLLLCLFMAQIAFSQAPSQFKYQAVAKDASGDAIANQSVSLRVSIRQTSASGTISYQETSSLTTSDFGAFSVNIGTGTPTIGTLAGIDWSAGTYYMQVELDVTGGTSYADMGTSQLLSVPYSLYAKDVENKDDADADPANELQILSISGDQLTLSNTGGTVTLPNSVAGSSPWTTTGDDISYDIGNVTTNKQMNVLKPDGSLAIEALVFSDIGSIRTYGANGNINNLLSATSANYLNHGYIGVADENGVNRARMFVNADGQGTLNVTGPNGTANVAIGSSTAAVDRGFVRAYNENNALRAQMISDEATGAGHIQVYGTTGSSNAFMSYLSSSPNRGYIGVQDWTNAIKAGIIVNSSDQGVVFGDVKNFRMPHPTQLDKEIWYASLEGPEAAAYTRGTTALVNGEAIVTFPEHYGFVANASTMTVTLTPLSADSKGIAVVEKTDTGFKVKELANGTGNYEFDWRVECIRKGYEDYRVIRDASEMDLPEFARKSSDYPPVPATDLKK